MILVSWAALAGCGGTDGGDTKDSATGAGDTAESGDTTETGDTTDTADTTETGDSASADRPVIVSADVYCYYHDIGEPFWNWEATCTATDPQGTDSLARGGTLTVTQGGTEVASYVLACDPDTGVCTTSFPETADDLLCSTATAYTFTFVVMDEDDNLSDPVAVTGRAQ